MKERKTVIGIMADNKIIEPHLFHAVGDKYIRAIMETMDAVPVLLPALGQQAPLTQWLELVDGILLTGAYSDIEVHHYGSQAPGDTDSQNQDSNALRDPGRDYASLAMIPMAIEQGIPILGICRGFQEMNVALGGTLHPKVQEVAGKFDHRENRELDLDQQYGLSHPVTLTAGGWLEEITGQQEIMVNSLHQQGIDRLAKDLEVEAVAEDGLVEAVKLKSKDSFAAAVQWHPEWKVGQHPQ